VHNVDLKQMRTHEVAIPCMLLACSRLFVVKTADCLLSRQQTVCCQDSRLFVVKTADCLLSRQQTVCQDTSEFCIIKTLWL
jgi:hypothetical protein